MYLYTHPMTQQREENQHNDEDNQDGQDGQDGQDNQENHENQDGHQQKESESPQNKKMLSKQSKTILRKLAYKSGVNSLSNACYSIIYRIIDTLLEQVFEQVHQYVHDKQLQYPQRKRKTHRKTIRSDDLAQVLCSINDPAKWAKSKDESSIPIFTGTVFKRQIKQYISPDLLLSANGTKTIQTFIEATTMQILRDAGNISSNSKRTRVLERDMILAWKMFKSQSYASC